jgi:predicted O-methyltransferase YrrM
MNTARAAAIEGWFLPEELEQLATWASEHKRIVELGSHLGQSARVFGDNTPGTVCAVDTWEGEYNGALDRMAKFTANCRDLITSDKVHVLLGLHENLGTETLNFVPDMIFIDGDHHYDAVKRDIAWAQSVLAPGGLICGHDAEIPDIVRALNELAPDWKRCDGYLWAFTK